MNAPHTSRERGLLSVASQYKGTALFFQNTVVPHLETTLVKVFAKHFCEEELWDYITPSRWGTYKQIQSSLIGVYTTISDYTNKKGETKPAHFSENGDYVGSIKQLGDTPASYLGHFRITKSRFEAYMPENPTQIADFFRPKELSSCCPQGLLEEPLPVPARKMKRPTIAKE